MQTLPAVISQALPDDAETVSSILLEAADWLRERNTPMWRGDELLPERIAADVAEGHFFLARCGGEAAGTIKFQLQDTLFWPDTPPNEAAFVHRLAVRRAFAGGELSTQLLHWAGARAKSLGRHFLRLDCEASRSPLRAIYERHGFRHHSNRQVGPYFVSRYELPLSVRSPGEFREPSKTATSMTDLQAVTGQILEARASIAAPRSALVAITGIDGCGKGYVTAQLVKQLAAQGVRAAIISVDGWLNLPQVRFDRSNPAEHFYLHAIRFDEMFNRLILPLRDRGSLRLEADYAEETAAQYRRHIYEFAELDVVLLEGIYLLKRPFQAYYDLSVWIECSFETALERAIARAQEGLTREATVEAYRNIYFPAQEIHFQRDDPRNAATLIVNNDARS